MHPDDSRADGDSWSHTNTLRSVSVSEDLGASASGGRLRRCFTNCIHCGCLRCLCRYCGSWLRCRCCKRSCVCRSWNVGQSIKLSVDDQESLHDNLNEEKLILSSDVQLGGELFREGSQLVKVGGRRPVDAEEARQLINDCLERNDRSCLKVRIKAQSVPFPWCIMVRCPCCVVLLTFLLAIGLMLFGGIYNSSIQTDFDSVMDSDGIASLSFSAFIHALNWHKKRLGKRRRLQEIDGPLLATRDRPLSSATAAEFFDAEAASLGEDYLAAVEGGAPPSLEALAVRGRRLARPLYKRFIFSVTYVGQDAGQLLSPTNIRAMMQLESRLKALPEFKALCDLAEENMRFFCEQGISFANYAFPLMKPVGGGSEDAGAMRLLPYGNGSRLLPLPVAMKLARRDEVTGLTLPRKLQADEAIDMEGLSSCANFDEEKCAAWEAEGHCEHDASGAVQEYMRDFCAKTCSLCGAGGEDGAENSTAVVVEAMRSHFFFQAFCCYAGEQDQRKKTQALKDQWGAMVSVLANLVSQVNLPIRVFYKGDGIETFDAMSAVQSDAKWALCSCIFVFLYATLYTGSMLLAIVGLGLVVFSIPCALSVFAIISGSHDVSLMMCISVFIMIGIGSDMLFVYTDFWKQSKETSRDPVRRLKFTYKHAFVATSATTFTTTMSFLANLLSVLRALREFGFVMGICVVFAWFFIMLAYPSMLLVDYRLRRSLRLLLGPTPNANTMGENSMSVARKSTITLSRALDTEDDGFSARQQGCLQHFAEYVFTFRWFIIFLFMGITVVSSMLIFQQVEQETEAPATFGPDHNQVAGRPYDSLFSAFDPSTSRAGKASPGQFCSDLVGFDSNHCELLRCSSRGAHLGSSSQCRCLAYNSSGSPGGKLQAERVQRPANCLEYRLRWSMLGGASGAYSVSDAALTTAVAAAFPADSRVDSSTGKSSSIPMMTAHWETGREGMGSVVRLPDFSVQPPDKSIGCGAVHFGEVTGQELGEVTVTGSSSLSLDTACCMACRDLSGCEFWVREVTTVEAETATCFLRHSPRLHRASNSLRGGWAPRLAAGGASKIEFQGDLHGEEVGNVHSSGQSWSNEGFAAWCCVQCRENPECEFWVFDGRTCWLRRQPREHVAAAAGTSMFGGMSCQAQQICREMWTCYCDTPRCNGADPEAGRGSFQVEKSTDGRRLAGNRPGLQGPWTVLPSQRTQVALVFGLEVTGTLPLLGHNKESPWMYLDNFQLDDPWAQRKALDLCSEFPQHLKVADLVCWLIGFKAWFEKTKKDTWPMRPESFNFNSIAEEYAKTQMTDGFETNNFVWFGEDSAGQPKPVAMYTRAYIDVNINCGAAQANEEMLAWSRHIDEFNSQAQSSIKGVWHVSSLWVRAEAETVILQSTLKSLCVSLSCVVLGALGSTRSFHLAVIVMGIVTSIIIGLLFLMVVVYKWKIGAIEVLSLIIFVGFAVDYCLHIAHKYHAVHVVEVADSECDGDSSAMNEDNSGESGDMENLDSQNADSTCSKRSSKGAFFSSSSEQYQAASSMRDKASMNSMMNRRTTVRVSEVALDDWGKEALEKPDRNQDMQAFKRFCAEERKERAKYAVKKMGSAIIGSAATTIGCACFLLPCQLHVFYKMGAVVCGVTIYALLFALLPLPALLIILGPTTNTHSTSLMQIFEDLMDSWGADLDSQTEAGASNAPRPKHYTLNFPMHGVAQYEGRVEGTRHSLRISG